jgi:hypothetical protein
MLLDVMGSDEQAESALAPTTRGYQAAQGVRLFHAAVRNMILTDTDVPWDESKLGKPINQEDLLGTLAAVSVVTIRALDQMGITVGVKARNDYLHLWLVIGHLLGIDFSLLYNVTPPDDEEPLTYAEMQLLAEVIFQRQGQASASGQELIGALFGEYERALPRPLWGLPAALTRRLVGDTWADLMAVPRANAYFPAVVLLRQADFVLSRLLRAPAVGRLAGRWVKPLYELWIQEKHGTRPAWQVDGLRRRWRLRTSHPAV